MNRLFFTLGLFSLLVSLGAQPVTTYQLDEVVVAGNVPWEKALKRTIGRLSAPNHTDGRILYYGNARYYQACYLDDRLVMTCDTYGWYIMQGLLRRSYENQHLFRLNFHSFYFNPVYHNTELDVGQFNQMDTLRDLPVVSYLSKWLYKEYYIYLPCFVPEKYYKFELEHFDGKYYTIRFKTNPKFFPEEMPFCTDGVLIIASKDHELKSIRMDHIISCTGMKASNYKWQYISDTYKEQAYTEALTIHFSHSGIITRMEHRIVWNKEEDRDNGILSISKPLHAGFDYKVPYSVIEYWEAENCTGRNASIAMMPNGWFTGSIEHRKALLNSHEYRSQLAPDITDKLGHITMSGGYNTGEMAGGRKVPFIHLVLNSSMLFSWSNCDNVISLQKPLLFREP